MKKEKASSKNIKVIDLFCGIGGLTHGLIQVGMDVIAGIDNDESCRYGYENNNNVRFINEEIQNISANFISKLFGNKDEIITILVGCAPCQPFSRLNPSKVTKYQMEPLEEFSRLIKDTRPDIVSMENVSGLSKTEKYPVFKDFLDVLNDSGYSVSYEVVDVSEYGIPQKRKRLVLLASLFGEISLIPRTHVNNLRTVRDVIGKLEKISSGEISQNDNLHQASLLSKKNLTRIKATPHDGGSSKSWSEDLRLECHKKESGKTYGSVYGRMSWDKPSPTMTTQCVGLGNGRFGHPEQNRAITLREAAIFQTFPKGYIFSDPSEPFVKKNIAKYIGNAVPVELGVVIGKSIMNHLRGISGNGKIFI